MGLTTQTKEKGKAHTEVAGSTSHASDGRSESRRSKEETSNNVTNCAKLTIKPTKQDPFLDAKRSPDRKREKTAYEPWSYALNILLRERWYLYDSGVNKSVCKRFWSGWLAGYSERAQNSFSVNEERRRGLRARPRPPSDLGKKT